MAKQKYDGVIEAVHFTPDGQVAWLRGYERRGLIFGDRVMFDRATLVERLKAGKRFMVGQRKADLGSVFEVNQALRLVHSGDQEYLVVGEAAASQDRLDGIPII
jgi:hypothetical protein